MAPDERPWLALYDEDVPAHLEPQSETVLEGFRACVARTGERPLIHYFDLTLTVGEVDRMSDAFAVALAELGVRRGDRVAMYLQNIPQFVVGMLAIWKVGAVLVPVNPMLKERELTLMLGDSGATTLVTLESLYADVAAKVVPRTGVQVVVTTSELDLLGRVPAWLAQVERRRFDGTHDLLELVRRHEGEVPPPVELAGPDLAFLTYTSGTTGTPKGAMNSHANVMFNSQAYRDWMGLDEDDVVLAVAPLFHITGLIGHMGVALLVPMPMILMYRFDPGVTLDAIERHRATFTVASITVFIALLNHSSAAGRDLTSFRKVYSGGAPIAPAMIDAWETQFGAYIHNIYGLTESTSPSHIVPRNRRAPVDPTSGALSVGVPIFDTLVEVVDEQGAQLRPGGIGEFVTSGPQVVEGYWQKPEETARALPGGKLHTGDVGFMDPEGWFYVVDRKKDLINVAGYKVWPREVEDVLYEHPAVREAAVVGLPDAYRGETVKAFVSLKAGREAGPDELIAFCRERMAAYKYPRAVEVLEDLPKTPTGKILRRELRSREHAAANN